MSELFGDLDLSDFWKESAYALKNYVGRPLHNSTIRAVERELGYTLPASYVELMRIQNGGIPWRPNHRVAEPTTHAADHVAIAGLYSVGGEKLYSLLGGFGSRFWPDEWGYPPIGIYFADCPSAGHDMLCLDYRDCGPTGEPRVVHVDQEWDYKFVLVAETFEAFVRGLEGNAAFEPEL